MRGWINIIDGLLGDDRIADDEHATPAYDFLHSLIAEHKYSRPSGVIGEGASREHGQAPQREGSRVQILTRPHITEGKVHPFRAGYASSGEDVLAYENPTEQQALTALTRSVYVDHKGVRKAYLRGICVRNKRLIIWNGFHATHDDARLEFFPKMESHDADFTTFEIGDTGPDIIRQGDYDITQCRYYQNCVAALEAYWATPFDKTIKGGRESSLQEMNSMLYRADRSMDVRLVDWAPGMETVPAVPVEEIEVGNRIFDGYGSAPEVVRIETTDGRRPRVILHVRVTAEDGRTMEYDRRFAPGDLVPLVDDREANPQIVGLLN